MAPTIPDLVPRCDLDQSATKGCPTQPVMWGTPSVCNPANPEYCESVSQRLDKSWKVLASHQTPDAFRCVDVFWRPDGSFGFEEFRRDPEDMGMWTPVAYFSGRSFKTEDEATTAAMNAVPWLTQILGN